MVLGIISVDPIIKMVILMGRVHRQNVLGSVGVHLEEMNMARAMVTSCGLGDVILVVVTITTI